MAKESLQEMSSEQISALRKLCLRSFFWFCKTVMGYDDITPELHGALCAFLESPVPRKQVELPRSFVKTWIGTIAFSVWITLPRKEADEFPNGVSQTDKFYSLGPNMRILVASYVIANSMKMIGLIRKTYERNQAMMILFPEVIPENFNKTRWSNSEACINRLEDFTEATFEAGGIGGSTTSRHYDLIIEDDLIYANKDDLTGKELQPNQEDIDKAIGWHKLAMSLLVPGDHTRIHNIGTRWAKHDLIDYIRENEPDYVIFKRFATKDQTLQGEPEWPEMYGTKKLEQIRAAQGPYMFSTQYLGLPMSPEDQIFKAEWLQYYVAPTDVPKDARIFTTVDLSGWDEPKRKGMYSRGVVLTCAWDLKNNCWILHYDVGRFDPSQVINLLYKHNALFKPESLNVESVYYQKAIAHFARIEMEKRGWMNVRQLQVDTGTSKELRIRELEPYASNLAIHCRKEHKDFITEFIEYVPNTSCRKDILDALAMQIRVARPGVAEATEQRTKPTGIVKFGISGDDLLDVVCSRRKPMEMNRDLMFDDEDNGAMLDLFLDPFEDRESQEASILHFKIDTTKLESLSSEKEKKELP